MSLIVYLIKVSLSIAVFILFYRIALRRLTFFSLNRFFLLGSLVLSFLLPVCSPDLSALETHVPAGIIGIDWEQFEEVNLPAGMVKSTGKDFAFFMLLPYVYYIIAALFLMFSVWKIFKIFTFRSDTEVERSGKIRFFMSRSPSGSYTLMRRIYLDARILEGNPEPVRQHEMVHARQLHSLDLILMELAIAFLWFNPFVFLFRRYVSENHEFLADSQVQKQGVSLADYLQCLKVETGRMITPAIANNFRSSTLKKRIIMLTNKQSRSKTKWLYLLVIPVSAVLLIAFSDPSASGPRGIASVASPEWLQVTSSNGSDIPSIFPLDTKFRSEVTWDYNQKRLHPIYKEVAVHKGMDIRAPRGTSVYAAADGMVITAEFLEGWGKLVVIQHGEHYTTHYAHLNEIKVASGDVVKKGAVIGTVGSTGKSTGDHLHYEVRKDGENVDPKDYFNNQ